ncbi:substrate-binding periplasmic protein [Chitinimonas sp. BJB300]|uniref:substrate-binding periplasmic protein n=1 Tax=Chitinimonas sp. BJB300 TaxID=1559339 RepID=UPI000C109715|nr:transporter substrate-binding domain-containing protein [Chitinimonas sp. BJB300]PHV09761.1 hypothetical protein CSQ89_19920 [Chitinimonas sp. BJB300]TSJ84539.1 amino acid ABC transporter substrate-binding protein [Chitinimonas sp. BJB300]
MKSSCLFLFFAILLNLPAQATTPIEPTTVPLFMDQLRNAQGTPLPPDPKQQKIIELIGREAGLRFEIKTYPWRRALKLAERGEGLLWEVVPTPDRARLLAFSAPIIQSKVWMVVPADKVFPYAGVHSLLDKTVGINGGVYYGKVFIANRDRLFKVEEEASSRAARLAMLARGRVDVVLFISFYDTATEFAAQINDRFGHLGHWAVLPQPLSTDWAHIGAARKYPISQYLPIINRAIANLQQRGEIHTLFNRHDSPSRRQSGSLTKNRAAQS